LVKGILGCYTMKYYTITTIIKKRKARKFERDKKNQGGKERRVSGRMEAKKVRKGEWEEGRKKGR
jgi:hypothetical protein